MIKRFTKPGEEDIEAGSAKLAFELRQKIWDRYMVACREQEAAFDRAARRSGAVSFAELRQSYRDAQQKCLTVLNDYKAGPECEPGKILRDMLWMHPMASVERLAELLNMERGDVVRIAATAGASTEVVNGIIRMWVTSQSSNVLDPRELDERSLRMLQYVGELSIEDAGVKLSISRNFASASLRRLRVAGYAKVRRESHGRLVFVISSKGKSAKSAKAAMAIACGSTRSRGTRAASNRRPRKKTGEKRR